MRYQFIEAHSHLYPVRVLCRGMQVSRSGYYAYRQRQTQPPAVDNVDLAQTVKLCFLAHRRRYGARRLCAELKAQGLVLGRYRVRTLWAYRPFSPNALCHKPPIPGKRACLALIYRGTAFYWLSIKGFRFPSGWRSGYDQAA